MLFWKVEWSTVLMDTVTPVLAAWNAVTESASACFGTASESLDPTETLPVIGAVVGVPTAPPVDGATVDPVVAVAEEVLHAARTAGRTVNPAAPTRPFLRISRLETCPPESKPARFS